MSDPSDSSDSDEEPVTVIPSLPEILPATISSVWEHPLLQRDPPHNDPKKKQKVIWRCLAPGCGKEWNGANSSKALAHGSRDNEYCSQVHVKPCKGVVSQAAIDLFCSLIKTKERRKNAIKRANDLISDDIVSSQETVSDGLQEKRKKSKGSPGFAAANSDLSRNGDEASPRPRQLDVLSSFDKSTIEGCNSADLDAAIAQLVYCKGLPFSFAECPYFQRVLQVARSAPRGYKPPKRKALVGEMLDIAYITQLDRDLEKLVVDADIFGLAFFGDGATIHKCPLVNIFASGFHAPATLIEIVDCTKRLVAGEKKDGAFISSLFLPVIESLDSLKDKTDIVFFDGGSNFQLAGRIIQAKFPRITVVHGLEHVLSLVFEDISQIPVVRVSVVVSLLLYYMVKCC